MRRVVAAIDFVGGVIGLLALVVAVARKRPIEVSLTGVWRVR